MLNDKQQVVERLMGIPEHLKSRFIGLAGDLSPENLTCDGELPNTEVDIKYRKLMKGWMKLEKELGRTITEVEVWGWMENNG